MAHHSLRMSLAGTNLTNELPLRVHHSLMRSYCAAARASVDLPGSWLRFTSQFREVPPNHALQRTGLGSFDRVLALLAGRCYRSGRSLSFCR